MKAFDYAAPRSLPEACALLAARGDRARVIAGGTDLLLKMKAGRLAPELVINIKRLPELRGVTVNGALRLGALTTLEELRTAPTIREHYPALAVAAGTMASTQIRQLATVGGNLCNAAPSADLAPILIAYEAVALLGGPAGERRVPLENFFVGPGQTVLKPGELLVAVEAPPPRGPAIYLKYAPRACMDIAVVGVALAAQLNDGVCQAARLALGAVAPTPMRAPDAEAALQGGPLTAARIEHAGQLAAAAARPIDDARGSAWYRRRLVEVLTRRGAAALATVKKS